MGAATSVVEDQEGAPNGERADAVPDLVLSAKHGGLQEQVLSFIAEEARRCPEASDITDLDAARKEVKRYRDAIRALEARQNAFVPHAPAEPDRLGSRKSFKTSPAKNIDSDNEGNEMQINQYQVGVLLGVGTFGVVVKAYNVEDGQWYAMKIIDRQRMKRKQFHAPSASGDAVKREIAIQKRLKHHNILPLFEVIDGGEHPKTYLVTKLVDGGALMPDTNEWDPIPEARAQLLFRQLVSALHYLHGLNIIHKDIKPSNMLVEFGTDRLYLSDFGVAQIFKEDELPMINSTEGTMAFIAPEMCSGKDFNGKLADVWAAGASLYMMVTGHPPFIANSAHDLVVEIAKAELKLDHPTISVPLADMLTKVMTRKAEDRMGLEDIWQHPWCIGVQDAKVALPTEVESIEPSACELALAVSPLSLKSFEEVGATVWIAKRSLFKLRKGTGRTLGTRAGGTSSARRGSEPEVMSARCSPVN